MRCLLCKSNSMVDAKSTYFAQVEGGYIIIENVPCKKCEQCGEVVYSASIMERIDEIINQAMRVSSKIYIMDYAKAA